MDITAPKTGTQTGQATASLEVWQNGIKLTTYTASTINADGKVCFPINVGVIPGLNMTKGFDNSGKVAMQIGGFMMPTKLLGAGPNGLQTDLNNDYSFASWSVAQACGQPGQPTCLTGGGNSNTAVKTGIGIGGILSSCVRPPNVLGLPKAEQSTGHEFKEPKVSCVRKTKPTEKVADDAPKKAAAKPRPKPAVAAAPPALIDPNAPPKPKPKPRPKAAAKPAASNDDCE